MCVCVCVSGVCREEAKDGEGALRPVVIFVSGGAWMIGYRGEVSGHDDGGGGGGGGGGDDGGGGGGGDGSDDDDGGSGGGGGGDEWW